MPQFMQQSNMFFQIQKKWESKTKEKLVKQSDFI